MIYECKCKTCDISEYEASVKEEVPDRCPKCGAEGFMRLISLTKFLLVGGGWASDGYSSSKL
jgi:putative FmdB family regulatory protein